MTKQSLKHQPDYYKIIPKSLWSQVDIFITELKHFPFSEPIFCPHCQSKNFRLFHRERQRIQSYYCDNCRVSFNRLTKTPFAWLSKIDQLDKYSNYYLSGLSTYKISEQTKSTRVAVARKEKAILWFMQQKYLELYQWWINHHQYQDHSYTPMVKKQAKQFINWLTTLLNTQQANCPSCHKPACYYKRNGYPTVCCTRCHTTYSLMANTALYRIHHPQLWLPYANLLVKGLTNQQISKELGVGAATVGVWRNKFIQQMECLGLADLVYWLNWQTQCNRVVRVTQLRKGKHRNSKTKKQTT